MNAFNVLTTERLGLPHVQKEIAEIRQYDLPACRCVQMKASSEVSVNRSILNIITTPHLRAAHVFHYQEDKTTWTVVEPQRSPLTKDEVKGSMVYAIQQIKSGSGSVMQPIVMNATSFIQSTKNVIDYLQSFSAEDKLFVILLFKNYGFVTGNYYDETTLCRALLNFSPRDAKHVIRTLERDVGCQHLFSFGQTNLLEPRIVRFNVQSVS